MSAAQKWPRVAAKCQHETKGATQVKVLQVNLGNNTNIVLRKPIFTGLQSKAKIKQVAAKSHKLDGSVWRKISLSHGFLT